LKEQYGKLKHPYQDNIQELKVEISLVKKKKRPNWPLFLI